MQDTIRRILTARVYDVAIESPLDAMPRLKREDLQPVHSFKLRGAYNKMVGLDPETLARGVICASAGNHAQGVALAAQKLGARAVIVMPRTTPAIKVEAVRSRGAEIVLHGDAFDEASAEARRLEAEHGLVYIHPYDDPDVIAGQGTIGLEILRQHPDPIAAIFVPIGGGGLAAGIGAYVKFLRPEIRVIGVEPDDAASMKAALAADERVVLNQVGLFADGVAVRQAGEETFRLCREVLDEVITVDTDAICAGVKDIFDDTRATAEPSGALSLAGLKLFAERAEIGEQREALLAVTIPEQAGSYRRFIQLLGNRSITEFNYRYADAREAHIFVGVQLTGGIEEKRRIVAMLHDNGYPVLDLSDNEMAKVHIRYMVGGRVPGLRNELLYRFQFPERPGALLNFLNGMAQGWNISLFHYRNHGADHGRVLTGMQVPQADLPRFRRFLDELGYPYWDETQNPAYRIFLDGNAPAALAASTRAVASR